MEKSLSTLSRRTYCNNACDLYDVCPMKDLAIAKAKENERAGLTGKPECALKDKPEYIKDAFENIYSKPLESGLIDELKRFLMLLSMKAGKPSADVKEIKEAVDALIKVYKTLFVDVKKKDVGDITFNVKILAPEKEKKIIDLPLEDYQINDPESLFSEPR